MRVCKVGNMWPGAPPGWGFYPLDAEVPIALPSHYLFSTNSELKFHAIGQQLFSLANSRPQRNPLNGKLRPKKLASVHKELKQTNGV
jgi:hypothetical protein